MTSVHTPYTETLHEPPRTPFRCSDAISPNGQSVTETTDPGAGLARPCGTPDHLLTKGLRSWTLATIPTVPRSFRILGTIGVTAHAKPPPAMWHSWFLRRGMDLVIQTVGSLTIRDID